MTSYDIITCHLSLTSCSPEVMSPEVRAMSMSGGIMTPSQADCDVMGSVLIWHMYRPPSSRDTDLNIQMCRMLSIYMLRLLT